MISLECKGALHLLFRTWGFTFTFTFPDASNGHWFHYSLVRLSGRFNSLKTLGRVVIRV